MFNGPVLILAAGMERSASTWLYNAARLLISNSPELALHFSYGWIGDWNQIPKKNIMLIKVHDFNKPLVDKSKCILYSYRDIRDVIASCQRKFNMTPSLELADNLVVKHENWMKVADFIMRYETMLHKKEDIVADLARLFGFANVDPAEIIESIDGLNYKSEGDKNNMYNMTNLYHDGHITDGRHGSWKGLIDDNLIHQIEQKHQNWFKKHGYQLEML